VARTISDYLLAETPEKLRHASEACGLLDRYDTGNLSATNSRASAQAETRHRKGQKEGLPGQERGARLRLRGKRQERLRRGR